MSFPDVICEKVDLYNKLNGDHPFVVHEFKNSYLVVGDHYFYKGYCMLFTKRHVRELHELTDTETTELALELKKATQVINDIFKPWKMNHMLLGNQAQHIHWHIIPRYEDDQYHKSYPFSDVMKGEVDLSDYAHTDESAKELADLIRKNWD
ncbi:MAG: HIT family protein [Oligoflexia bacterium]|nr:HIT family protein [Oligoflexia bacterium]